MPFPVNPSEPLLPPVPTPADNWQTWVRFIATTALLLLNLLAQMRPQPVPAAPSVVNVQPATPAAK